MSSAMQIDQQMHDEVLARTNIVQLIGQHVPLKKRGHEFVACCPFHNEKSPSFSVNERKQIFKCFGCGKGGDAIRFMRDYYGLNYTKAIAELAVRCGLKSSTGERLTQAVSREALDKEKAAREQDELTEKQKKLRIAMTIWQNSKGRDMTLVRDYLSGRGIDLQRLNGLPPTLRSHPALFYDKDTNLPGMVAPIQNVTGHIIGVHRTFLARHESGRAVKAPVEMQKKVLGEHVGGTIRLSAAGEHLLLAEGIETGLTVRMVTGLPVWVVINLNNFSTVELPECVKKVTICADNDSKEKDRKAHLKIIHTAAQRFIWQKRKCAIAWPPDDMDFNDWIMSGKARV